METEGLSGYQGGGSFHCTVEALPGHIRRRKCQPISCAYGGVAEGGYVSPRQDLPPPPWESPIQTMFSVFKGFASYKIEAVLATSLSVWSETWGSHWVGGDSVRLNAGQIHPCTSGSDAAGVMKDRGKSPVQRRRRPRQLPLRWPWLAGLLWHDTSNILRGSAGLRGHVSGQHHVSPERFWKFTAQNLINSALFAHFPGKHREKSARTLKLSKSGPP